MGLAAPRQRLHLNSGSSTSRPLMPEQRWCTQQLQPEQRIELPPTPCLQTPHGNRPASFSVSRPVPDIKTLVLAMFTRRPFFSRFNFHSFSFDSSTSGFSAVITRSSAYRSSQGHPVLNSVERASSTIMNSSRHSTEP